MSNIIDEVGFLTIIVHHTINFRHMCTSSVDDRVIINGWPQILKETKFKVGDKLMFIKHQDGVGIFLFLARLEFELKFIL